MNYVFCEICGVGEMCSGESDYITKFSGMKLCRDCKMLQLTTDRIRARNDQALVLIVIVALTICALTFAMTSL